MNTGYDCERLDCWIVVMIVSGSIAGLLLLLSIHGY